MPAAPSGEFKTPVRPDVHACRLPRFTWQDAGREWVCECGATWMVLRRTDEVMPPLQVPTEVQAAEPTALVVQQQPPGRMPDFGEAIQKQREEAKGGVQDPPPSKHSDTCARTLGTGMCTCHLRTAI
jgi:hypothetical protein